MATNAQVNVVMTDKVLVQQLQKELTRMENELRNFAPTLLERELLIKQVRVNQMGLHYNVVMIFFLCCQLTPNNHKQVQCRSKKKRNMFTFGRTRSG